MFYYTEKFNFRFFFSKLPISVDDLWDGCKVPVNHSSVSTYALLLCQEDADVFHDALTSVPRRRMVKIPLAAQGTEPILLPLDWNITYLEQNITHLYVHTFKIIYLWVR
jgi:hypothetical protein